MKVDFVYGDNLGVAAPGCAALHAETRAERGFTQTDHRLLADAIERVAQADGGGRLALARRGWADRRDKNELPVRAVREAAKKIILELGDEAAKRTQGGFGRADLRGDLCDRLQARGPRGFDILRPEPKPSPPPAGWPPQTIGQRIVCADSFCKLESWR